MELLVVNLIIGSLGFITLILGVLYTRKLDKKTKKLFKELNIEW